ncbi:MAG: TonB family protein, partial [Myxococcota bacterium]
MSIALLLSAPAPGRAQTAGDMTRPTVQSVPDASLTLAAQKAGIREAKVLVEIVIDASGKVTEANVVKKAGYGLDEVAKRALLGAKFSPATRDGQPVPVKVRFSFEFLPPPAASLRGTVVDASRAPVGYTAVTVVDADGVAHKTQTDASGRFSVDGLAPGPSTVRTEGSAGVKVALRGGEVAAIEVSVRSSNAGPEGSESPADSPEVIDVLVEGYSPAERLRRSAQAVTVIEFEEFKRTSLDLGQILARQEGIAIRRGGGLGSDVRVCLDGLCGDSIRVYLDGVPIQYAGFPQTIANVPPHLFTRLDVYRGVVPTYYGADAQGGLFDLITYDDKEPGTSLSASYQVSSFASYRASAKAQHIDGDTGLMSHVDAYFDYTDNDYQIDVEVPDRRGRLSPAKVTRLHDRYQARGGSVTLGVVDRPWADELSGRGFYTVVDRDLQHNVVMTIPYGEAAFANSTAGGNLRYKFSARDDFRFEMLAAYAFLETTFLDVATCIYDWFGLCIRERPVGGETDSQPRASLLYDHTIYTRLYGSYRPVDELELELSSVPSFLTRTGDERRIDPGQRDPLTAQRDLLSIISGLSGTVRLLEDKLENVFFGKLYLQELDSEEPLPGGTFRRSDRSTRRLGVGNAFRYRFIDELMAKLSYEYATRLPDPEEIFGDGVLTVANLELQPEVSHNVNLEVYAKVEDTAAGDFGMRARGVLRETDQQIVLLGNDRVFTNQNVFGARSIGGMGGLEWTSPGDWVVLAGNATYLDYRNTSSEGTFGDFDGDRIPN